MTYIIFGKCLLKTKDVLHYLYFSVCCVVFFIYTLPIRHIA